MTQMDYKVQGKEIVEKYGLLLILIFLFGHLTSLIKGTHDIMNDVSLYIILFFGMVMYLILPYYILNSPSKVPKQSKPTKEEKN